ncbi:MAG: glucosyltransferase [Alphaproteobacteria bacterium]
MTDALVESVVGDAPPGAKPRGVYLAGDTTNPTVILRITSLINAGCEVSAYTFRRHKFNTGFQPAWRNTPLGETVDRKYKLRVPALLRACFTIARNTRDFRGADFIYARLFDVALLALFGRWWSGSKARFIYEVEDVQAVFFETTFAAALFRWLERRVLARTKLLVLMSPGFLRGYFEPVQKYRGATFVLENKIQLPLPLSAPKPEASRWRDVRNKWIIGWNGTLRCARSLEMLSAIAERLGDRVEIQTRGHPTENGLDHFMQVVNRHPNWRHGGEYTIPDDLEAMYGGVHFSWCFDYLDPQGNSPLLLACRMYQGGYYGAVPLLAAGSEMERFLKPHRIGHAFAEPAIDQVCDFLANLTWDDYARERERVSGLGATLFLDTGDDARKLVRLVTAR